MTQVADKTGGNWVSLQNSSCTAVLASAFLLITGAGNGQTQSNSLQPSSGQNFYITVPQTGQQTVSTNAVADTASYSQHNTYISQTNWNQTQQATYSPEAYYPESASTINPSAQQVSHQHASNYYASGAGQTASNYYTHTAHSQQPYQQTVYPTTYVSSASTKKSGFMDKLLHRNHTHTAHTYTSNNPVKAAKGMAVKASSLAGRMQTGVASWYGGKWHGRKTANGERYNQESMTAAHKTLPFGTVVRVTNERNGRECMVRINNRGPFTKGRILDLSKAAARQLGMVGSGVAKIKMEVVGRS